MFHCGHCRTELSVPLSLQGVKGPCPCCAQEIQAPQARPAPLHLPPLDGEHDLATAPVPPPSRKYGSDAMPELPGLWLDPSETVPVPRAAQDPEALGLRTKLLIPMASESEDDQWRERHLEERRRASFQALPESVGGRRNSAVWRVTRMAMMVGIGGLCAGLAIFLQDRNWVLDLPWRPERPETMVEVPVASPEIGTPASAILPEALTARQEVDPFVSEDPSDLEHPNPLPPLSPIPEAQSIPTMASPIAGGR